MRNILTILLCCLIVVTPGCGILTPQQKSNLRVTLDQELAAGDITKAQHDAAVEALDKDKPFDWATLGVVGLNIAMALIGAPAIVRLQRGVPATPQESANRMLAHAGVDPEAVAAVTTTPAPKV